MSLVSEEFPDVVWLNDYFNGCWKKTMIPRQLCEYLLLCSHLRFPTEPRKLPYLQMSHLRESPRTLWTIQVLCDLCFFDSAVMDKNDKRRECNFQVFTAGHLSFSCRGRADRWAVISGDLQGQSVLYEFMLTCKELLSECKNLMDVCVGLSQRQMWFALSTLSTTRSP